MLPGYVTCRSRRPTIRDFGVVCLLMLEKMVFPQHHAAQPVKAKNPINIRVLVWEVVSKLSIKKHAWRRRVRRLAAGANS